MGQTGDAVVAAIRVWRGDNDDRLVSHRRDYPLESSKKLVGYSGLGAGVHDSGKEHIEKRITKSGRKELRWALVEAAWRAIRISPYWKEQYEKYLKRMRKPNQAIVVIARKLLVVVWHVLSKEETDIHVSEEDLAYKMLVLSWDLDENVRMGLSTNSLPNTP